MSPLRRRTIEDMQIRNLTPHAQRTYVEQVVRFARHFRKSPEQLGPAEIRTYQFYLPRDPPDSLAAVTLPGNPSRILIMINSRLLR